MKEKKKYTITLNWYGTVHTYYTYAHSPRQAASQGVRQHAEIMKLSPYAVHNHFVYDQPNGLKVVLTGD